MDNDSTPIDFMDHDGPSTRPTTTETGDTTSSQHGTPVGRRSSNTIGTNRIFCPVIGCPDSLASSSRHFKDFPSIKAHIDDHCTGHRPGAVPVDFLTRYDYTLCSFCDKTIHKKFNGSHPKCRPRDRLQEQVNTMRNQGNINA